MMPDTSTALRREEYEYRSASFSSDPYRIYRRWQPEAPVCWPKKLKGGMISRYAGGRSVVARYCTGSPSEVALVRR
jgi:hypothetical protein